MKITRRSTCAIALATSILSTPGFADTPQHDQPRSGAPWLNQTQGSAPSRTQTLVSAPAAALPGEHDSAWNVSSVTYDLYQISGLAEQVRQFPAVFLAAFDQEFDQLSAQTQQSSGLSMVDAIKQAARESFEIKRFEQTVVETLEAGLTLEHIDAISAWHREPLGQKITALEIYSGSAEGSRERVEFLKTLQENPPQEQRKAALMALDEAVGMTESAVAITTDIQMAMAVAVSALVPEEKRPDVAWLQLQLNAVKPALREQFKTLIVQNLLHTYQTLSLEELERYRQFSSTDAGQHYSDAIATGLSRAMLQVSMNLAVSIHEIVERTSQHQTL